MTNDLQRKSLAYKNSSETECEKKVTQMRGNQIRYLTVLVQQLLKVKNVNFQLRVYLWNWLDGFEILECITLRVYLSFEVYVLSWEIHRKYKIRLRWYTRIGRLLLQIPLKARPVNLISMFLVIL